MYILGVSCYYHDSSAALLKDGVVVAAAQEERFSRIKHDTAFPQQAIAFCLARQGITMADVAYVAFYEKPLLKFERILYQHLHAFPKSLKIFLGTTPALLTHKLRVAKSISKKLQYRGDVVFVDHHASHAAGSFFLSPFDTAAILTVDGVGEWTTTAFGVGTGTNINLTSEITFPSSLGLLYSTITAYLGFSVNNSEYKVMGLSPYGAMDRTVNPYYKKLRQVIDVKPDGSYRFDLSYFTFHYKNRMPSAKLCQLLDGPVRNPDDELTKRHQDIAAAVQLVTEDVLFAMLRFIHQQTGKDSLVLSGGVALNSVANGRILRNTPFKNIWIQPDPGDGGTSIGAASYLYHHVLGHPRVAPLAHPYLGPQYAPAEIKQYLDDQKIKYQQFATSEELVRQTAELIYRDNVVGWFCGGMEWGPRALGARSILSNPTNPAMQEILNVKVKHREKFRPFAPVVCREDALTYFECDQSIPEPTDYMLMVYPVRQEWRQKIPAVTHVDGSGRLQTVDRQQNPLYYDVIKAFGALSGVPILINTSFNIRGEPIVCSPHDAYRCMMGTGIDYLVMGEFLIARADNPADMWDSEQYAVD